eukprot:TRINITY_DN1231_c0_g2_i1.p1 TRINITY_DN1231_c0_g2~~TRINITY_DN1231_c0_g2_i1.p1  ORF type:complete len:708 (-),score=243.72 TRINITY_DN1231_c0_g2_i1:119-2242(-)
MAEKQAPATAAAAAPAPAPADAQTAVAAAVAPATAAAPAQAAEAPTAAVAAADAAAHVPSQDAYQSASLYVGDLRTDVTETQLFDIFKSHGPISSIRVCRDMLHRSLGYAYVNFLNPHDAGRALETLNFTAIGGKPCRIMWSCRDPARRKFGAGNIFIKFLDKSIDNQTLYDTFCQFGTILSSKVETDERGVSKGYGYVHFEKEESARAAIEKVNGKEIAGKIVYVGWFVPRKHRNADEVKEQKFTNIYVRNLDASVTQEAFQEKFGKFGEITSCVIMCSSEGKSRGFGFANYKDHDAAVKAVTEMNDTEMAGKQLLVARAQSKRERDVTLRKMHETSRAAGRGAAVAAAAAAAAPPAQTANLYIKNLDELIDDTALKALFEHCGTITSCKVMLEDKTRTSRGFGFVCFATPEEAAKAVTEMNGAMVHQKPIYVALAQKKEQRRAQLAEQYNRNAMMKSFPGGMPPGYPQMFYPNLMPMGYPNPAAMMAMRQQQLPWMGGRGGGAAAAGGAGVQPFPAGGRGGMFPGGRGSQGQQPYPYGYQQGYAPYGMPQAQNPHGGKPEGAGGVWNSRVKFNQTARNQPSVPYGQMQQRGPQMHQQRQRQQPMEQPQQQPQQQPQAQPQPAAPQQQVPALEEQRQLVGERLYTFVQREVEESLWGKITGMLLESLGIQDVSVLLSNPPALSQKIREAHEVYINHMKQVQAQQAQ